MSPEWGRVGGGSQSHTSGCLFVGMKKVEDHCVRGFFIIFGAVDEHSYPPGTIQFCVLLLNNLSQFFIIHYFRLWIASSHPQFLWSPVKMVTIQPHQLKYTFCFNQTSVWSHSWHIDFVVEWRLFSLRLLSETTSLLVSHEVMAEEKENLNASNKLLSLIKDSLLPQ